MGHAGSIHSSSALLPLEWLVLVLDSTQYLLGFYTFLKIISYIKVLDF